MRRMAVEAFIAANLLLFACNTVDSPPPVEHAPPKAWNTTGQAGDVVVIEVPSMAAYLYLRDATLEQLRVGESLGVETRVQTPLTVRVSGTGEIGFKDAEIVIDESQIAVNGRPLSRKYMSFIIEPDGRVTENAFIRTFE